MPKWLAISFVKMPESDEQCLLHRYTACKFHGAQDNWLEDAENKQPLGKLAKPDEVAELFALMLSDRGGVMCGSLIDYDQEIVGTSD